MFNKDIANFTGDHSSLIKEPYILIKYLIKIHCNQVFILANLNTITIYFPL